MRNVADAVARSFGHVFDRQVLSARTLADVLGHGTNERGAAL
jgi:hypothetical protein